MFVTVAKLSSLCTMQIMFHDNFDLSKDPVVCGWKNVYRNQFLVLHFTDQGTLVK